MTNLLCPPLKYMEIICIKIGKEPTRTNGLGVSNELSPNRVPNAPAKITTGSVDSALLFTRVIIQATRKIL